MLVHTNIGKNKTQKKRKKMVRMVEFRFPNVEHSSL